MRSRGSFRTTYAIVLVLEVPLSRRKELDHIVALLQERIDASIKYQINKFFSEEKERLQLVVWFDVVVTLEREPGLFLRALMGDLQALVAHRLRHCVYTLNISCSPRVFWNGLLLLEDGSQYPHTNVLVRLVEIQPVVL